MRPPLDRDTRRRIRLLRALQGRDLHQAYLLDRKIREDLADEAAYGAEYFDESLLTPELLVDLRAWAGLTLLEQRGADFSTGTPWPTSAITPAVTPMSPYHSGANRGTVVIVPGGLASSLADIGPIDPGLIWVDGGALCDGRFQDLRLATYAGPDVEKDLGYPDVQIRPDGPVPILYGSLKAALHLAGWNIHVFDYDWRKHMEHHTVAARLKCWIENHASAEEPIHIITHSQGCLVARLALQKLADELTCKGANALINKVILLGPANYGTFAGALAVAGAIKEIPMCQIYATLASRIQPVLASFTALYLLMPWKEQLAPSLSYAKFDVRRKSFWTDLDPFEIQGARLTAAFPSGDKNTWGDKIDTTCFNEHISVILGSHPFRTTPGGVQIQNGELTINHDFDFVEGDGWVPDKLARIDGTKTYRAECTGHIRLPMAARVINAVLNILDGNAHVGLPEV